MSGGVFLDLSQRVFLYFTCVTAYLERVTATLDTISVVLAGPSLRRSRGLCPAAHKAGGAYVIANVVAAGGGGSPGIAPSARSDSVVAVNTYRGP